MIQKFASVFYCVVMLVFRQTNCFAEDDYFADSKPVPSILAGLTLNAHDTLDPRRDSNEDAQACIDGLCWKPTSFAVHIEQADAGRGDWLIRFPSAISSGNELNDLVAVEWYEAKDQKKQPLNAPAAIIVHESGSGMTVGRLIANGLRKKGIHTFMIQLPYYGKRRGPEGKPQGEKVFEAMKQSIADVRRAKDAIAELPFVDATKISVQGTSLGGFVTATSASLDDCFHRVLVLLAGGDLIGVVANGKRDAAKLREELERAGVSMEQLKKLFHTIEPLRVAHRLNPKKTWLFSGEFDDVVPLANAIALAKAIGMDETHHVIMLADHYTGVLFLPTVIQQMADQIKAE